MGSERNFRSHYYEKVGFRGVEEKKSLDMLLGEKPIDLDRIHNFCLRFPLPGIYRVQVWQLLLGVLPRYTSSTEWVWKERVEQFQESERAITVTKKISKETDKETRITIVWLLERNALKFDLISQLKEDSCENFSAMVKTLYHIVSAPEEVYWIASKLYMLIERKLMIDCRSYIECLTKFLVDEPSLLNHLETCGVLRSLLFIKLFGRGFAGVFQPCMIVRLWDKLIGGSGKVLVYVLASALLKCRIEIMGAETLEEILSILFNIKEERQEKILTQALDLWEMDGCPLVPGHLNEVDNKLDNSAQDQTSHFSVGRGLEGRLSMEINVT